MRLTLRTLLAYRDGVLGAEDAEEMHRRIHQSEDASNLLRRVERVTSSAGRTSTTLVGKGLGGDPNSIAEYLDDVLPKEKVPELERICLESDEYLDELASCHTLLSSAMHTRVPIPAELRELANSIGNPERASALREELRDRRQKSSKPKMIRRVDEAAGMAGPHLAPANEKSHVQDDLHQDAGNDPVTPKEESNEGVEVVAPMLQSGGESIKEQGLSLEGASLTHEVPEYLLGTRGGAWRIPLGILGLVVLLAGALYFAIGPLDRVSELFAGNNTPPKDNSDLFAATIGPTQDDVAAIPAETADGEPSNPGAEDQPLAEDKLTDTAPASDIGAPSTSELEGRESKDSVPEATLTPKAEADGKDTDDNAASAGSDSEPATRELTWSQPDGWGNSVLLSMDATGKLRRRIPNEVLEAGSKLFVGPHSLASFTTPNENDVKLLGPAVSEHIGADEPWKLGLGRMLVTAGPSQRFDLETPQGSFRLKFSGSASTAAIQFEHRFEKYGSALEPEAFRATLIIVCDAPTEIVSTGQQELKFNLAAGEGLAVIAGEKPRSFQLQSIPTWYQLPPSRPIDQEAAAELSADLVADQPGELGVKLSRLASHWRAEEAALAVGVSMLVGDWDALVKSGFLENPRASIHVPSTVALARQLIAARPKEADKLRKSLKNQYKNGAELYRLLLGSEQADLEGTGLTELIDTLDADNLAERHLGFAELNRVTGRKLGVKPSQPNRASLLAWRREAAMSKLELVKLPDVIRERMNNR
ncbi:MAG: hypothetical protein AAGG44_15320 [Planctomycetota bacterium]